MAFTRSNCLVGFTLFLELHSVSRQTKLFSKPFGVGTRGGRFFSRNCKFARDKFLHFPKSLSPFVE